MRNSIKINVEPVKLNEFKKAIEKIGKLAMRNGMAVPTYKKSPITTIERTIVSSMDGEEYVRKCMIDVHPIEIMIEDTYQMKGWDYVATVHFREGIIDQRDVEEQIPDIFGLSYNTCDHCNGSHPARNKSFIFKNAASDYKQIGTTCSKDFFGVGGEAIIKLSAELVQINKIYFGDDFENEPFNYEVDMEWLNGREIVDMKMLFAYANHILVKNDFNYVKKLWNHETNGPSYRTNTGESTTELVESAFRKNALVNAYGEFEKAMDFVRTMEGETTDDYGLTFVGNLKTLGEYKTKARMSDTWKVVWTILKYEAHKKELIRLEEVGDSKHIGVVGEKSTVKFIVEDIKHGDGFYGPWTLYVGVDSNGNSVKKFGKIGTQFVTNRDHELVNKNGVEVGDICLFNAMIKSHEENRGLKSTALGRLSKPSKKIA